MREQVDAGDPATRPSTGHCDRPNRDEPRYDGSVSLTPPQRKRLAQVSIDAAYDFLRDAAEQCPELRPHVDVVLAELDAATTTLGVRDEVERVTTRSPFIAKN